MTAPRWEGDERGRGIGDSTPLRRGVDDLVEAMGHDAWVAEDPEAHLLPHIARACAEAGLQLLGHGHEGVVFVVRVAAPGHSQAEARAAAFRVIGSFAETATSVRQRDRSFEVVTGLPAADTTFQSHGHLVRLELVPPA